MKNVIFISAPASGKGTYSNMLKERCGYIHISTGDLLRNIVKENSDLGKKVAEVLSKGNLVEDELMFKIIKEKLIKLNKEKSFILDGIPRTIEQAEYLDNLLKELNCDDYCVIYLNIDYEVALKRALGRLSCLNCGASYNKLFDNFKPKEENICDKCGNELISRTDDNEESFKQRFENYKSNTLPILEYYENSNKLTKIDVQNFTNEQIFDIIINVVK